MDLNSIDAIIRRCNLINSNIGTRLRETQALFEVSVLTTGNYILKISDEAIQDQRANCLHEDSIKSIVAKAKKRA